MDHENINARGPQSAIKALSGDVSTACITSENVPSARLKTTALGQVLGCQLHSDAIVGWQWPTHEQR